MISFKKYILESLENKSIANSKGYNIGVVYHGTPNKFTEFSYKNMGTQGTTEGYGFYFTDKKERAEHYVKNGVLLEVFLKLNKSLSIHKITMSKADLMKFIRALDPNGDDFLQNYGDTSYEGYNKILNLAVSSLLEHENDVDLISDIVVSSGMNVNKVYSTLMNTLGYDGIIDDSNKWGQQTIFIVFHPNQIKLAGKTFNDSGEEIPQSERFNSNSNDIRY